MTLTKYQRGDIMEGWNDCPPDIMKSLNKSTSSLNSSGSNSNENVDINGVLEELFSQPNSLSPRLYDNIKDKLTNSSSTMELSHKQFLANLLHDIKYKEVGELRTQVIEFMMINDGVSSWCIALKKFIENITK